MTRKLRVWFLLLTFALDLAVVAPVVAADDAADRARIRFIMENWGASKETVRTFEGKPPLDDEGEVYSITFLGSQARVVYLFLDSGLVAANIILANEPAKLDQLVPTFDNWKAFLSNVLGPPSSESTDSKALVQLAAGDKLPPDYTVSRVRWDIGQSFATLTLATSVRGFKLDLLLGRIPTSTTSLPSSSTPTVSTDTTDFRRARWGMTKEEVRRTESAQPLDEGENYLAYWGTLGGKSVVYVFTFKGGRLYAGAYRLAEDHSNFNLYVDDFNDWKRLLQEKYGKPLYDRREWKGGTSIYKDTPEDWGWAVALGHLRFEAAWKTERSWIAIVLAGDNYEAWVQIFYYDLNSLSSPSTNDELDLL